MRCPRRSRVEGALVPNLELAYQDENGDWQHDAMDSQASATADHPDEYYYPDWPNSDFQDGQWQDDQAYGDVDSIKSEIRDAGGRDAWSDPEGDDAWSHAVDNFVIGPNDAYNVTNFNGNEIPIVADDDWWQALDDAIDNGDPEEDK